jgi:tungstate transport system substrate-binding protein
MKKSLTILILVALIIGISVSAYYYMTAPKAILRISTTTSLYATGLLDRLSEEFEKTHPGVVVQVIPVGSGEALRKASMGDADLVLVHAPNLEIQYIDDNILIEGKIFAYNYFIIVGPSSDPAGIKDLDNATLAFQKIFEAGNNGETLFVSRGDNSGTHNRELFIWSKAGLIPGGDWYIESGTGMSQTLEITNEKGAYTLSDIGTYLKLKETGVIDNIEILVSGDPNLINMYSVYLVNPEKVGGVNYKLAMEFMEFIVSNGGQGIIDSYGLDVYGEHLFYAAKNADMNELRGIWEYFASPSG